MAGGVTVRDLGWERIQRELKRADGSVTKVGFPLGEEPADGELGDMTEVASVAAIHEFGAPKANIPERSFLRAAHDENLRALAALKKRLYSEIVEGRLTTAEALAQLGEWMTNKTQKKIRDLKQPALAPATVRAKARTLRGKRKAKFLAGGGNPLIDTGQMLNSVTHVEEVRG